MGDIIRPKHGPEWHIQQALIEFLTDRGWHVEVMHGNAFQRGIPDLWLWNRGWGFRWIDVKQPKRYVFTDHQKVKWPLWDSLGIPIWILTAANEEEHDKLFAPPNWQSYWKPTWKWPSQYEMDAIRSKHGQDDEFGEVQHGPEWHIQQNLITNLNDSGWYVEVMHGNAFQRGIPDLWLWNRGWGFRWVDVKNPRKFMFTRAQKHKWPQWESVGIPVWILTDANEGGLLFDPPNWRDFWKSSWQPPSQNDIDSMLDELDTNE